MLKTPTKCFANYHLTPEEFGFWEVCRSLSFKFKGKLIFDGRTIASYFGDTGKNTIYRLAKQLQSKGWFVCTKKTKRDKNHLQTPTEYQVLSHEQWAAKRTEKQRNCLVPESGPDDSNLWSQNQERSGPGNGNDLVPEPGHSTEYSSYTENKALPRSSDLPLIEEKKHPELGMEAGHEHGSAEKGPLIPETGPDARAHLQEEESADPFVGVPTSQLVSGMLPYETAMKLYHKFNKGTEYNQHRAEIIVTVLEYQQRTQEVQQ